jgi:hypothetical protein
MRTNSENEASHRRVVELLEDDEYLGIRQLPRVDFAIRKSITLRLGWLSVTVTGMVDGLMSRVRLPSGARVGLAGKPLDEEIAAILRREMILVASTS